MNILHVHNVAHVASNLVNGLNDLGEKAELYELVKINNNLPKLIKLSFGILVMIYELLRISIIIKVNNVEILHIHYATNSYLTIFTNIPFYIHLHGTDIREAIQRPLKRLIIKNGIKRATGVFYSTPDLGELINHLRSDAIFLPNPIDTRKFSPLKDVSTKDPFDVFSISKIDKSKGTSKIFSTIQNLINENQRIKILMFGFGNNVDEYSGLIDRFKKSQNVEVIEKVEYKKMEKLINSSKIILGQMSIGSLGCSELEAMACGKPVVSYISDPEKYPTRLPVISVSNSMEAKERILELLVNPNLASEIGEKSRKWIEENFDSDKISKRLLRFYKENLL